jgi:hypothetical protein
MYYEVVVHERRPSTTAYSSAVPICTPERFSVESDRPEMTADPRAETVTQSPCRQTPGKSSKYAALHPSCLRLPRSQSASTASVR